MYLGISWKGLHCTDIRRYMVMCTGREVLRLFTRDLRIQYIEVLCDTPDDGWIQKNCHGFESLVHSYTSTSNRGPRAKSH